MSKMVTPHTMGGKILRMTLCGRKEMRTGTTPQRAGWWGEMEVSGELVMSSWLFGSSRLPHRVAEV